MNFCRRPILTGGECTYHSLDSIADEVTRNKVGVAHKFFTDHFKGLGQEFKTIGKGLPDQLFSDTITSDLRAKLNAIPRCINGIRTAADKAVSDLLQEIGRSEDDVSRVLTGIFARARDANESELDRARARRERGRAPGKPKDAPKLQKKFNLTEYNIEAAFFIPSAKKNLRLFSDDGTACEKNKPAFRSILQKF